MKYYTFMCFLLTNGIFSQNINFTLTDKNIKGKAYLISHYDKGYYPNSHLKDSCEIVDGKISFSLKPITKKTLPYYLKIGNDIASDLFYIEGAENNFTIETLDFGFTPKPVFLKNIYREELQFDESISKIRSSFRKQSDSIYKIISDKKPSVEQVSFATNLRGQYSRDYTALLLNFVKNNTNSQFAFWHLVAMVSGGYDKEYERIYYSFSEKIKNAHNGKLLYESLMKAKKLDVNKKFPILELKDIELKSTSLEVTKTNKKIILIDFWYSYCAPCISQFDYLKNIYTKYKDKGFEIYSISTDKEKDINNWKAVIKKQGLDWKQFLDTNGLHAKALFINKFPTTFLVNENGTIIKKDMSLEELDNYLKENLEK